MDEIFGAAAGGDEALVGVLGILAIFYVIVLFVAFAFGIASYILSSLGLYTIAERRGLQNAWLAWLPIGNAWLLGSISDQYEYVVKGKITNRRKLLLALNVVLIVVYIGWMACMAGNMLSGYMGAVVFGMIIGWLAFVAVLIAMCVLTYVSYYDLFRSCQPSNAVLYLILSIFVSVTLPFLVFFVRKKDLGMPPRKQSLQACVEEMMQTEAAPAAETPEEAVAESTEETTGETTEEPKEEPKEEPTEE